MIIDFTSDVVASMPIVQCIRHASHYITHDVIDHFISFSHHIRWIDIFMVRLMELPLR